MKKTKTTVKVKKTKKRNPNSLANLMVDMDIRDLVRKKV